MPTTLNSVDKGSFKITISGIRNSKGKISVGIYNKKENFPKENAVYKNIEGKISDGKCTLLVDNLPIGFYSIVLLHDENENKVMDYNWIGIPQEGFGFSRNPNVKFRAPTFDETKIELNKTMEEVNVMMKYM